MAVNCGIINKHFLPLLQGIDKWAKSAHTRAGIKDPYEAAYRLGKRKFNLDIKELMYDTNNEKLTEGSMNDFIKTLDNLNNNIDDGSMASKWAQFFWQSSKFGRQDPVVGDYLGDMQQSSFTFRKNEIRDRTLFKDILKSLESFGKDQGLSARYGFKNAKRHLQKLDNDLKKAINKNNSSEVRRVRSEMDSLVSSTYMKVFDDFITIIETQMPKAVKRKYDAIQKIAKGKGKESKRAQKNLDAYDKGERILRLDKNDYALYLRDEGGRPIQNSHLFNAVKQYNTLMDGLYRTLRFGVDARIDSIVKRLELDGDLDGLTSVKDIKEKLREKLMPRYRGGKDDLGFYPHYVRDLSTNFMEGLMPHLDEMQQSVNPYTKNKNKTIAQIAREVNLYISGHAKSTSPEGDFAYSRNFMNTVSNYIFDVNRFNFISYMDSHYIGALSSVEKIYRLNGTAKGYGENIVDYIADLHKAANGDNDIPANTRALMRTLLGFEFISKLGINPRAAARNFTQRLLDYVEWGPVMVRKMQQELRTMTFKEGSADRYIENVLQEAGLLFEEISPELLESGLQEPASAFKMRQWNESTGKYELIEKSKLESGADIMSWLAGKSSWIHRKAENSNRKHTFKIAFAQLHRWLDKSPLFREKMSKEGKSEAETDAMIKRISGNYAKNMVIVQHFDYADYAKSKLMRTKVGRFGLQFQHFMFEFFERNIKIAKEAKEDVLLGHIIPGGDARGVQRAYRMAMAYFIAPLVAGSWWGMDFTNIIEHDTATKINQLAAWFSGDDEKIKSAFYGKGPLVSTLGGPITSDIIDIGIMMDLIDLDEDSIFTLITGMEKYDRDNQSTDLTKKIRILNSFAGRLTERHWPMMSTGHWGMAAQQELGLYPSAEMRRKQKKLRRMRKKVIPSQIENVLSSLEEGKL